MAEGSDQGLKERWYAGADDDCRAGALACHRDFACGLCTDHGVSTCVCTLFHLWQPHRAYFGEKDYQQLKVIQRMVYDLRMPVEVIGCPTIRAPDGLAMSSRNVFLSPPERQAAAALSLALFEAARLANDGVRDVDTLQRRVQTMLGAHPLIRVDYVAIVHPDTLQPITTLRSEGAVICLAAWIGQTRLIDNLRLSGS
jgi:pantoate--beta-alanine ligase